MKKVMKTAIIILVILVIIASLNSSGEMSKIFSFIANIRPLEKFIGLCILGWLVFVMNAERLNKSYFMIRLARAKSEEKPKENIDKWISYKANGLPDRENRLSIYITNHDGSSYRHEQSEIISLSDDAGKSVDAINPRAQVLVAQWTNDKMTPVEIIEKGVRLGSRQVHKSQSRFNGAERNL
jgi:hypothetical protein